MDIKGTTQDFRKYNCSKQWKSIEKTMDVGQFLCSKQWGPMEKQRILVNPIAQNNGNQQKNTGFLSIPLLEAMAINGKTLDFC